MSLTEITKTDSEVSTHQADNGRIYSWREKLACVVVSAIAAIAGVILCVLALLAAFGLLITAMVVTFGALVFLLPLVVMAWLLAPLANDGIGEV